MCVCFLGLYLIYKVVKSAIVHRTCCPVRGRKFCSQGNDATRTQAANPLASFTSLLVHGSDCTRVKSGVYGTFKKHCQIPSKCNNAFGLIVCNEIYAGWLRLADKFLPFPLDPICIFSLQLIDLIWESRRHFGKSQAQGLKAVVHFFHWLGLRGTKFFHCVFRLPC